MFLYIIDFWLVFDSSVEVLTKVMMDEQLAELFKHQQMALHHALPLGSYLLKPVQRILKYHLFLEVGVVYSNWLICRLCSSSMGFHRFDSEMHVSSYVTYTCLS